MRASALIFLLAFSAHTLAATPVPPVPGDSDELYLYNVAVFEFNHPKGTQIPWKDFGEPLVLKEAVSKKSPEGTVQTRSVRNLKIRDLAQHMSANGASLVANVPARPGDLVRAPCGFGTNVEVDFGGAALKPGNPSSLVVKVLEIKTEVPAGAEFVGAMTGSGGAPVDQVTVRFPTIEGDTFIVEVSRTQAKSKEFRGCLVLIAP